MGRRETTNSSDIASGPPAWAALVLLCCAAGAAAAPSLQGGDGLVRVVTGEGRDIRGLEVSLAGLGWGYTTGAQDSPGAFFDMTLAPLASFHYSKHWEFSAAAGFGLAVRNNISTDEIEPPTSSTVTGLRDSRIGAKYSLGMGRALFLGGYAGYDLPTLDKRLYGRLAGHRGGLNLLLLPGARLGAARLDATFGYRSCSDRLGGYVEEATGDTVAERSLPGSAFPLALGLSYGVEYATVMVEVSGTYRRDEGLPGVLGAGDLERTKRFMLNDPLWLGAGLKTVHPRGYYSVFALEYNLQGRFKRLVSDRRFDKWHLVAGMGLSLVERAEAAPERRRTMAGKVTDGRGRGLPATVTVAEIVYPNQSGGSGTTRMKVTYEGLTIETDSASGRYVLGGLKIDGRPVEIKLQVNPKDTLYLPKTASWLIAEEEPRPIQPPTIVLDENLGFVRGRIIDSVSGRPVAASVVPADPRAMPAPTGPDGLYRLELRPDVHRINVRAQAYNPDSFMVAVRGRDTLTRNVKLRPIPRPGEVFTYRGIDFVKNKPFFQGEGSFGVLREIYDLLAANPTMRVRIGVHTDNLAGKRRSQLVSEERAIAIRQYLTSQGIDPSRMEPAGYGPDHPVEDNRTRSGRSRNRRVEVTVLE
jgi:outer membrane protein OmpA-like peptidoglycan-associated protein